jgi:hypothetical protein
MRYAVREVLNEGPTPLPSPSHSFCVVSVSNWGVSRWGVSKKSVSRGDVSEFSTWLLRRIGFLYLCLHTPPPGGAWATRCRSLLDVATVGRGLPLKTVVLALRERAPAFALVLACLCIVRFEGAKVTVVCVAQAPIVWWTCNIS